MSHRAGTGDAPIPGLVTSSWGLRGREDLETSIISGMLVIGRNPAYKQRLQKQKVLGWAQESVGV